MKFFQVTEYPLPYMFLLLGSEILLPYTNALPYSPVLALPTDSSTFNLNATLAGQLSLTAPGPDLCTNLIPY